MLFLIGALRAVVELAGLCLLGQGILHLLAGPGRAVNPVYRLFAILAAPPCRLLRLALPAAVPDRLVPFLTFALLFLFWLGLALLRIFIDHP